MSDGQRHHFADPAAASRTVRFNSVAQSPLGSSGLFAEFMIPRRTFVVCSKVITRKVVLAAPCRAGRLLFFGAIIRDVLGSCGLGV